VSWTRDAAPSWPPTATGRWRRPSGSPRARRAAVRRRGEAAEGLRNAGAIFVGPWSPVSLGDYLAGSNHVLPTAGSARFASGLRTSHFQRASALVVGTSGSLAAARPHVAAFAEAEGLPNHARAVEARFASAAAHARSGTAVP